MDTTSEDPRTLLEFHRSTEKTESPCSLSLLLDTSLA